MAAAVKDFAGLRSVTIIGKRDGCHAHPPVRSARSSRIREDQMTRGRSTIALASLALSACAGAASSLGPEEASALDAQASIARAEGMDAIRSEFGTTSIILTAAVWDSPVIPVCWESLDPQDADGRRWTREAIEGSWESVSRVDFTGWGACQAGADGIRIAVMDAGAHTRGLGKRLAAVSNGMRLNFSMNAWNAGCRESRGIEACVRIVAIHEFGHALGFAHEQNRPETAEVAGDECAGRAQGTAGDRPLTPWDRESVMNYCNPVYGNEGRLSAGDIFAVQAVYGLPVS